MIRGRAGAGTHASFQAPCHSADLRGLLGVGFPREGRELVGVHHAQAADRLIGMYGAGVAPLDDPHMFFSPEGSMTVPVQARLLLGSR